MAIYNRETITVGDELPHAPSGGYIQGDPKKAEKITLTEFTYSPERGYCARVDGGFRGCEVTGDSISQIVLAVRASAAVDQNRTTDANMLASFMSKFPGVKARVKPGRQETV